MSDHEACEKCGGSGKDGSCPIYHGQVGFCPAWADGETALETCTRYYEWYVEGKRRCDDLHDAVRAMPRWLRRIYSLDEIPGKLFLR